MVPALPIAVFVVEFVVVVVVAYVLVFAVVGLATSLSETAARSEEPLEVVGAKVDP